MLEGLELENYALVLIPFSMWLSAQALKFVIYSVKHGINWKYLFEYGHMPSSHAACMTSLIFTAAYYEGLASPAFALALVLGLLTIYDSVKFRAYIGDYGKTINLLTKDSGKKYPRLKERVGHTTEEAVTGVFWGIIGSIVLIQILGSL